MTLRSYFISTTGFVVAVMLTACGGEASTAANTQPSAVESSALPTSAAETDSPSTPASDTSACERLTSAELSDAFDVTFGPGAEVAAGQCIFESDGAPQFRVQVYPGSSTLCQVKDPALESVTVVGNPGWWDERGAQARVCLPRDSVAVTLYGGGGDNSVHRAAMLDLLATAAEQ